MSPSSGSHVDVDEWVFLVGTIAAIPLCALKLASRGFSLEMYATVPRRRPTPPHPGLDLAARDEAAVGVALVAAWRCFGDGGLDALVNCSSYDGEVQDCLSVSEDEYKKTMKVNVITPWLLIKAMAKRFRDAQSGGSVVCLTQIIGAERGLYPGAAAYGTSLGAVHQLVRLSAMELSKHKIRVNAVCHGLHLGDKFPVSVGEEKAEKATGEEMPLRRWLDPDKDLASTVLYLVGDEGSANS
ncbi:carbonyl reductase [NADPH] 2-like [Hordeum vulgare subsp. vulgare]|uniref:carbonyl reductase [NADPH] 2-like n=1 Tax=Hordeum vulgare subsp. vulgare TaxID=112509 RepID=UPI001D1A361F|nr:carbonyl reductase [NADPH] 2-like [Hordeum vulgare subsp. vulgare]